MCNYTMHIHGIKYINKKFTIHVLNNYSNTLHAYFGDRQMTLTTNLIHSAVNCVIRLENAAGLCYDKSEIV